MKIEIDKSDDDDDIQIISKPISSVKLTSKTKSDLNVKEKVKANEDNIALISQPKKKRHSHKKSKTKVSNRMSNYISKYVNKYKLKNVKFTMNTRTNQPSSINNDIPIVSEVTETSTTQMNCVYDSISDDDDITNEKKSKINKSQRRRSIKKDGILSQINITANDNDSSSDAAPLFSQFYQEFKKKKKTIKKNIAKKRKRNSVRKRKRSNSHRKRSNSHRKKSFKPTNARSRRRRIAN